MYGYNCAACPPVRWTSVNPWKNTPTLHSDKAQRGQTEGLFGLPTTMGTVYARWLQQLSGNSVGFFFLKKCKKLTMKQDTRERKKWIVKKKWGSRKKKENKTEECCLKTDKTNSYHIKWHLGGLEQCLHHVPQAPACSRNVAEAEVCHIADRQQRGGQGRKS